MVEDCLETGYELSCHFCPPTWKTNPCRAAVSHITVRDDLQSSQLSLRLPQLPFACVTPPRERCTVSATGGCSTCRGPRSISQSLPERLARLLVLFSPSSCSSYTL